MYRDTVTCTMDSEYICREIVVHTRGIQDKAILSFWGDMHRYVHHNTYRMPEVYDVQMLTHVLVLLAMMYVQATHYHDLTDRHVRAHLAL